MTRTVYYAHTHNGSLEHGQPMEEHARLVAEIAGQNAHVFGEQTRAELMGKIHDLGKYGELFQLRLENKEKGLDHWTAGAHLALFEYRSIELALAIQGHHIGLQKGDKHSLEKILAQTPNPTESRLTETDMRLLKYRLEADLGQLPAPSTTKMIPALSASTMFDTRMLFSALVDADFLDTERTMNRDNPAFTPRPVAPLLQAKAALERLEIRLEELNADTRIPEKTRGLRKMLANACQTAASSDSRIRTLTAPTGTGKTLGMLRFALHKACRDEQHIRRIIVVLPFLSILDQTVEIYRKLFKDFGEHYILEHHSLTGTQSTQKSDQQENPDEQQRKAKAERMLTQNWDAPIVITTSVQFLESLHANRGSSCRKLHNIAGSIVLFDEVQTLPVSLAVTTLKTLSRLANDKYHCTVVFSTATQPAFDHLHNNVLETGEKDGWQPEEIVPATLGLFNQAKRVRLEWDMALPTTWDTMTDLLTAEEQALCIVNLKRHALTVAKLMQERKLKGIFHLSTSLCPAHRQKVLKKISAALEAKQPCRLIATQCVEAGVDLDFPRAFRALAPLDAIAQAAGRCNRNASLKDDQGNPLEGILTVFLPEEAKYPPGGYERATLVTQAMLKEFGNLNIDDPETFRKFFRRLYAVSDTDIEELAKAIKVQDYLTVNKLYRLIDQATVNVVVPYNKAALELMREARNDGIHPGWMRRARAYTVSVYRDRHGNVPAGLEPVPFRPQPNRPTATPEMADDWFICRNAAQYDKTLFGFLTKEGGSAWNMQ
jgi:CRISPR-associated endonuclease/helicase Cas3